MRWVLSTYKIGNLEFKILTIAKILAITYVLCNMIFALLVLMKGIEE